MRAQAERAPRPGGAPVAAPVAEEKDLEGEGWAVVLFNDDVHDMVEVASAIMQATGFDAETAWAIMMRAHEAGKAGVVIAEKSEAERVASVLRTAKLTVEIKQV